VQKVNKPIYYNQNDKRWGKIEYSNHNDKKQTIGTSGCGIVCAAMVLATFLEDPTILPDYTANLAVRNGFRTFNEGTAFDFFPFIADVFGLKLTQSYHVNDAVLALDRGALVICSMTKGYFTQSGHFILAYAVQDGEIYVNDPAHPQKAKAPTSIFEHECQKYFIFEKIDKKEAVKVAEMTVEEAKAIVKAKGLSDETMAFLNCYKYADELFLKLAK
jgi:hypothetical protein